MKTLDLITFILVIAGALNWLLVGLFNFDLVAAIFQVEWLIRLVYILVGLSGIYQIFTFASMRRRLSSTTPTARV